MAAECKLEINFWNKLLLTKTFPNGSSGNMKLLKNKLSMMVQLERFGSY